MSEEIPKIIPYNKENKNYRKNLGDDKIFIFQCSNENEKLRIGLKEINAYSPYYYEAFYTKEELNKKNEAFKAIKDVDNIINQLLKLFENKDTILKYADEGQNIIVSFQVPTWAEIVEISFELEKKTIENKDEGLMFLFDIQKNNISIINEIKEKCKNNPNDPIAKEILKLLPN